MTARLANTLWSQVFNQSRIKLVHHLVFRIGPTGFALLTDCNRGLGLACLHLDGSNSTRLQISDTLLVLSHIASLAVADELYYFIWISALGFSPDQIVKLGQWISVLVILMLTGIFWNVYDLGIFHHGVLVIVLNISSLSS